MIVDIRLRERKSSREARSILLFYAAKLDRVRANNIRQDAQTAASRLAKLT